MKIMFITEVELGRKKYEIGERIDVTDARGKYLINMHVAVNWDAEARERHFGKHIPDSLDEVVTEKVEMKPAKEKVSDAGPKRKYTKKK